MLSKFTDPQYEGNKNEIGDQIKMARNTLNVNGVVFFSSKTITRNFSGFADSLKGYFKYPVLIPLMQWKDSIPPEPPVNLNVKGDYDSRTLTWNIPRTAPDGDSAKRFVIYRFNEEVYLRLRQGNNLFYLDNPEFILCITNGVQSSFKDSEGINSQELIYMVTALDKFSNESNPAEFIFTNNSAKEDW